MANVVLRFCSKLVPRLLSNKLTQQTQRSKVFNNEQVLHVNSRGRSSVGRPIIGQETPNCRGVPTGSTILQQVLYSSFTLEQGTDASHSLFYFCSLSLDQRDGKKRHSGNEVKCLLLFRTKCLQSHPMSDPVAVVFV